MITVNSDLTRLITRTSVWFRQVTERPDFSSWLGLFTIKYTAYVDRTKTNVYRTD
jgi:hypothetical protein